MSTKNYNLSKIRAFIGDDDIVMVKMIGIFLENTPLIISKIEEGLEKKDFDQLSFYAHKLKSSIDNFSIIQLTDDIRLIERYSKERSSIEKLPLLVTKLVSTLKIAMEEIETDLKAD